MWEFSVTSLHWHRFLGLEDRDCNVINAGTGVPQPISRFEQTPLKPGPGVIATKRPLILEPETDSENTAGPIAKKIRENTSKITYLSSWVLSTMSRRQYKLCTLYMEIGNKEPLG